MPIKLKFHMKTPFDNVANIYKNYSGHMPKMTDMPIYGKNPLKNLLQNQIVDDLRIWYATFGMWGLPSLFN